ncbi:HAD family hydrolase [Propionibacteriaceae bacterium Y1923]|uniref:HAD family hydrolase n=1 Tax=Aestuariimicrobium sp. Y1814 TaxID=3418742 RepID=UPI003C2113D4
MTATDTDLGPLVGRTFDAIIFDMDGTLVNSLPAVTRSWVTWAIHYGITEEQFNEYHGVPSGAIIAELIPEAQRDEAKRYIDDLELADVADVEPLPGAVAALESLQESQRAIATSCHRDLMDARIVASGIPRPDTTVTIDDVERGKPHPDPFLLAADRLGLDPKRCLVVEDATAGLIGARRAGCATLAVVTTTPREKVAAEADAVVDNLSGVRFVQVEGGVQVEPA